jgi:hypothetical protein
MTPPILRNAEFVLTFIAEIPGMSIKVSLRRPAKNQTVKAGLAGDVANRICMQMLMLFNAIDSIRQTLFWQIENFGTTIKGQVA